MRVSVIAALCAAAACGGSHPTNPVNPPDTTGTKPGPTLVARIVIGSSASLIAGVDTQLTVTAYDTKEQIIANPQLLWTADNAGSLRIDHPNSTTPTNTIVAIAPGHTTVTVQPVPGTGADASVSAQTSITVAPLLSNAARSQALYYGDPTVVLPLSHPRATWRLSSDTVGTITPAGRYSPPATGGASTTTVVNGYYQVGVPSRSVFTILSLGPVADTVQFTVGSHAMLKARTPLECLTMDSTFLTGEPTLKPIALDPVTGDTLALYPTSWSVDDTTKAKLTLGVVPHDNGPRAVLLQFSPALTQTEQMISVRITASYDALGLAYRPTLVWLKSFVTVKCPMTFPMP